MHEKSGRKVSLEMRDPLIGQYVRAGLGVEQVDCYEFA
jgi:hypothetical protein